MTCNYPTPGLIGQYMSVSIDHILLKLQKIATHTSPYCKLLIIYLLFLFVTILYLCIHSLMPSVVHYVSTLSPANAFFS